MGVAATDFDVVIAGGGIHGAGVAQAAAVRGHATLVIEKERIAAGTSSRSSKLIHGGLRYLESGRLGLVRESLRERRYLIHAAPDLVRWVPFHIPIYEDSRRRAWQIRAGLSLYALLAGPRRQSGFRSLPRSAWTSLDGLETRGLRAVFRYWDGQTDDAELTRAVMRSAESFGARLACPAEILWAEPAAQGVRIGYGDAARESVVTARVLVNAAGPWINEVLSRIRPAPPLFPMQLVQGAHIVLPGVLERGIYYAEAPADRRAIFVMPHRGRVLVGTTEKVYRGDPGAVVATPEEIDCLRAACARYFPRLNGAPEEAYAGLRVLPASHSKVNARSRETTLHCAPADPPRVLTIAGGKLTGFRATAERVLRRLAPLLPPPAAHPPTHELPLAAAASPPR